MHALQAMVAFVDDWHAGPWRMGLFPDAVGAEVTIRTGGRRILGFAISAGEHGIVTINQRIVGTPAYQIVVAHECAHIFQRHLVGFCGNSWAERQQEREAWDSVPLAYIPREHAMLLAGGGVSVDEMASHYSVPRALVVMRAALAVTLGQADGNTEAARQSLARSRRSLIRWCDRIAAEARA